MIKAPRGTNDILPSEIYKWQYAEDVIREICKSFGVSEIRTPVFENTELFERGVGDTTDVVEKEMYTFEDKGGRSITLRPEGTASAARSYIEHGLFNNPQPTKLYYMIGCYRYEKPQAGRYREFRQFGVEYYGSSQPSIDAEVMSLALMIYDKLGLKNLSLNINSIGCPHCREIYNNKLREYLEANYDSLCETCKTRFHKNPMRIIDCKSDICKDIVKGAPMLIDHICDECKEHFELVKKNLEAMGIEYKIDPMIVRGLDYYTKTVFEIIADNKNSNSTICGGGRYDGLIEEIGGDSIPACGFAMGLERLILTMEEQGIELPKPEGIDVYIGNIGVDAGIYAGKLVHELRQKGISADKDHQGKSVKAQMKYANKIGAKYTIILGDDEITNKSITVKDMQNSETVNISLDTDEIIKAISEE